MSVSMFPLPTATNFWIRVNFFGEQEEESGKDCCAAVLHGRDDPDDKCGVGLPDRQRLGMDCDDGGSGGGGGGDVGVDGGGVVLVSSFGLTIVFSGK